MRGHTLSIRNRERTDIGGLVKSATERMEKRYRERLTLIQPLF